MELSPKEQKEIERLNKLALGDDIALVKELEQIDEQIEELDERVTTLENIEPIVLPTKEELKGDKGDKGERGEKGDKGADGKDGKDGKDGRDGIDGKEGPAGRDGKDGAPGRAGWGAHPLVVKGAGTAVDKNTRILNFVDSTVTRNSDGTVNVESNGGVSSVSNSDGTLTISPTTGAVVASRAAITGDVSIPVGSNTATINAGAVDHNSLANLTVGDVHTQYALLAGRSGGQTLIGGTASGDDLELESTSNATKGHIRSRSNFIIGNGVAGVDYTLTFDGETNDTSLTWMEDEDYLLFADDITMNVGRKIFLDYAATTYLSSPSTSVTQFVVSGTPFFNLNASTEFQYFGAYTLGTGFGFWTNTLGFPGSSWFVGSNTYGATYRTVVNVANITSSTGDMMNFLTGASAVNTGSIQSVINSIGQFGIKRTTATAHLHLGAGTTSASTAPLKFTSGTSMTSAEAGAVEYTTDDLFFTISTGTARKRILFADPTGGLTSGRVPVATTNGRLTDDADLTFATDTLTATHYRANATITFDEEVDNGNSSTADTIDWTAGNVQKSTLTGNVTYTFTAPSAPGLFSLKMIQDGTGGRTATWPSAVKWQRGINPFNGTQAASEIDVAYFRYDGTNYQAWATYDHK